MANHTFLERICFGITENYHYRKLAAKTLITSAYIWSNAPGKLSVKYYAEVNWIIALSPLVNRGNQPLLAALRTR